MGITSKIGVVKHKHYSELTGSDYQGKFGLQIQNDFSQIRLFSGVDSDWSDSVHIDVNKEELTSIRDFITAVLTDTL